jgi:hypothetical protein
VAYRCVGFLGSFIISEMYLKSTQAAANEATGLLLTSDDTTAAQAVGRSIGCRSERRGGLLLSRGHSTRSCEELVSSQQRNCGFLRRQCNHYGQATSHIETMTFSNRLTPAWSQVTLQGDRPEPRRRLGSAPLVDDGDPNHAPRVTSEHRRSSELAARARPSTPATLVPRN